AIVSQPSEGVFRLSAGDEPPRDFGNEDQALREAEARIRSLAGERAQAAGTDAAEIDVEHDIQATTIEGRRIFIEARLLATASGRPRIADSSRPAACAS